MSIKNTSDLLSWVQSACFDMCDGDDEGRGPEDFWDDSDILQDLIGDKLCEVMVDHGEEVRDDILLELMMKDDHPALAHAGHRKKNLFVLRTGRTLKLQQPRYLYRCFQH